MADSPYSPHWPRVAELRPRLADHLRVHRHVYRGRTWFVMEDLTGRRHHRFPPEVWRVIGLLNGTRRMSEVWRIAGEELGEAAPSQDELIQLLAQLHRIDALQTCADADVAGALERSQSLKRGTIWRRLLSPFAIQIPLFDPDAFLSRTAGKVAPLFSRTGFAVWLTIVLPAVGVAAIHLP